MEYMTIQKNITHSPRKVRLVAGMIRRMTPTEALLSLEFAHQAAAKPLSKAIKTVLANAKGEENLFFKAIEINEGMRLKRFRAGARGRAKPYKRRLSHIKIVLTSDMPKSQIKPMKLKKTEKIEKVEAKKEEKNGTEN